MSRRPRSPIQDDDEGLSELYHAVLAGFATEEGSESLNHSHNGAKNTSTGTPGESNILSIYDSYGGELPPTHPMRDDYLASRPSQNGLSSRPAPLSAGTSTHANGRPTLPSSPRRTNRPLPQPPPAPPGSHAGPPPSRMPDAPTYYPDEKKNQPLARSDSRQLPLNPSVADPQHIPRSNSYKTPQQSQRGPDEPRRTVTAPSSGAGAHVGYRPPGAAPPTPPVPNGHHSPSLKSSALNGSQNYVSSSSASSPVVPPPRQASRGATEGSHRYHSSESLSMSNGRFVVTDGKSPEPSLKTVHSNTRSTMERAGGFESRIPDIPPGAGPSSSSSSYTHNYDDPATTPATTVERGNSLSSSIYAPVSSSSHDISNQPSIKVSSYAQDPSYNYGESSRIGESSRAARHAEEMQRTIASIKTPLGLHEDEDDSFDEYEDDPDRFVTLSLLSHLAVRLRDKVPRGTHVKGSIPYDRAFTGKDIVSTIQSQIQRELLVNMGISTNDRRTALGVARSLQSQLFFYEVEWGDRQLSDGVEDVFRFLDDAEGLSGDIREREELPTGVVTVLTKCYSPSCVEGEPCYAYCCPRRASNHAFPIEQLPEPQQGPRPDEWKVQVDSEILRSLPQSEVRRQMVIRKVIEKEEQYVHDLNIIESLFIRPLRKNNPEVIAQAELDDFIDVVFGNVLDLRECNRRLLETMYVRQREQAPIIQRIGDIFLTAAVEFRLPYPNYVGHLPLAEKRMKDELERNAEFRRFIDLCARNPDARRFDLRHFITRPSEHLQRYPVLLEAIFKDTAEGNPDAEFLQEAIESIRKLSGVAHVRTFQSAMLRGPTAKLEWHDLVSDDVRGSMPKHEVSRQGQIFELIKGEMEYVKDLENLDSIFIQPLKALNPPVIPRDRLPQFIEDVFYNFAEIHKHHRRLLDRLHEIQREEHPAIHSITAAIFDAALNWRDAYMDFIPHYPIAAYRVDDELANNLAFKTFVDQCTRNPDARKLDIKAFIYRPIPRLLRYELLLKAIMSVSPPHHEDKEAIPQVLEVIKALGKDSEPGVMTAKQKVELWKYNSNLVFKPGESVDMDLLADTRTLVHTGKLLRQPDTGFEWNGWSELFVLLFDNYLVLTKTKEKGEVTTKYHVNRRPIPLDLLSLANFTDPPQQRGTGILRGLRGGEKHTDGVTPGPMPTSSNSEPPVDSRTVFPCTLHHTGRLGGLYTLYAESAQARMEWKEKLEEALALRKAVTENNKVFEVETLSSDTFLVPSLQGAASAAWNQETVLTGKVTCSVPFSTADGMRLVAIGCAEGVWIGLRHDSKSMRRVLHLKMVTQCAMLEDFGIFLVLADKSLWAYHIEALVPSSPPRANTTRAPQKLNNHKDVQFFSVGTLNGRTLLIYMKKKALDSVFHVLEPVVGKIAEKPKAPGTFGRSLFGSQRSDWFRPYREFFLPSESFDLIFLKGKIAVLCTKGFEIMDLTDLKSVTIPQKDDPRHAALAKRCETSRPLGMFRSSENEFLLCYDDFGLYVDRYGDPSRPGIGLIEWEGTAERVACHPPYVLLFDSRFIEVRHIETGRLAQVIQGAEMRCIWDGRGSNAPPVSTPGPNGWQESPSQEARVHAVMRAPEPPRHAGSRAPAVAQQVVELVPTIPLFLPGSLSSPAAPTTYFPQGQSPPHSPRLHPQRSWR